MTSSARRRLLRIELLLALMGTVCLIAYGVVTLRALEYQRKKASELTRIVIESPTIERSHPRPTKADHQLVGRLEIPRVHLSVMVVDGDDDATLRVAAGHLPDTPLPWEFGNSAVAAHRDSFFRPLSGIRVGDQVSLQTPHGEFRYTVARVRVVEPNDVSVLAQTGHSSLTLVTCYPFSFVGHAPRRFIVQADHVPG